MHRKEWSADPGPCVERRDIAYQKRKRFHNVFAEVPTPHISAENEQGQVTGWRNLNFANLSQKKLIRRCTRWKRGADGLRRMAK